ncbi:MAG TPA: hypothetical protein VJV78_26755 [Polyangiales bacterium]|nr:hypothetical protein [Polyangiales bacterium]
MSSVELTMDLSEVVKNLVLLGLDEAYVRSQFADLHDEASWLDEIAALIIESESALVLPADAGLPLVLFQLIDALRQVGAKASCGRTADGSLAFSLHGAQPKTFAVRSDESADALGLVRAVVSVLPRAQQVLMPVASANPSDNPAALTLIVLERGTFVALRAAVGDGGLERKFERVTGFADGVRLEPVEGPLATIDCAQRWQARLVELEGQGRPRDGVFERLCAYDPRVAWPATRKRPPGDDFFQFCAGLADGSLARAFTEHDDRALADLLYRFALATCVGAHYDVAAARQNPGMSASGMLGLGQLTWAWFIFEALGAGEDAAVSGRLLDNEWVRSQERKNQSLRQRAYYDLGAFMRTGARGPALGRVYPLVPLTERAGWQDAAQLEAALATHSEITADQVTHHPLYYLWPASLYALARRARALEMLPRSNPFLNRPLELRSVDLNHDVVLRLKEQLLRFSLLDEERMAPLLDPLPVIVDVEITAVDDETAHGRTMLAARQDAEHRVSAPRAGRDMHPGEVWLFEVQGAKAGKAKASFDDLGEVSYNVAVPTGQWLERA